MNQLEYHGLLHGATLMHLSLLTPTHPRSGDGGDYWGFAKVI